MIYVVWGESQYWSGYITQRQPQFSIYRDNAMAFDDSVDSFDAIVEKYGPDASCVKIKLYDIDDLVNL